MMSLNDFDEVLAHQFLELGFFLVFPVESFVGEVFAEF